ncbi:MAG: class I SAM-dependent methyltransferase [Chloroflexi bacterium]|nr:class I SAM-dependent methyltransferase [Chloroflexota bacterium]
MANWRRIISTGILVGMPIAALGAVLLNRGRRQGLFRRVVTNVREFDMPSAGIYDFFAGLVLSGVYARIARDIAVLHPEGLAVDVGSGPGHLVTLLARAHPDLRIVGVDVSPSMVEIARGRAARAGLTGRVRFEVGDVGALPFPDGQVDLVISTLSLHHWPDPAQGLREIYRVLVPGGQALIYDVPSWLVRVTHDGVAFNLVQGATASPFKTGEVETTVWLGPISALRRLRLQKKGGRNP